MGKLLSSFFHMWSERFKRPFHRLASNSISKLVYPLHKPSARQNSTSSYHSKTSSPTILEAVDSTEGGKNIPGSHSYTGAAGNNVTTNGTYINIPTKHKLNVSPQLLLSIPKCPQTFQHLPAQGKQDRGELGAERDSNLNWGGGGVTIQNAQPYEYIARVSPRFLEGISAREALCKCLFCPLVFLPINKMRWPSISTPLRGYRIDLD